MYHRKRLVSLFAVLLAIGIVIFLLGKYVAPQQSRGSGTGPQAPELAGISAWLNSEPLTLAQLRGKVVLVDFWTYTCVNCIRTFPYLKDWHQKYAGKGLVIIGVHSPEFEFEKELGNVRQAVAEHGIAWPVALDNDFATWRAFSNRYWPHKFLIDKNGVIRYHHIGEGAYGETEAQIRDLLQEAGQDLSSIPVGSSLQQRPFTGAITREIYAGFSWSYGGYLANGEDAPLGQATRFEDGRVHTDGQFSLQGPWEVQQEYVRYAGTVADGAGWVALRFHAGSINMVVRPQGGEPFRVYVTLDGQQTPTEFFGSDLRLDEQGRSYVLIDAPRMYNLVQLPGVGTHEVKVLVDSPNFQLYTFTFGG